MSWDILVSCPTMLKVMDEFRSDMTERGLRPTEIDVAQQMSEEELIAIIHQFDGMIAGDDPLTSSVLQAGAQGRLRVVSKWGVGVDNIDLEAANRVGVVVTNTPGMLGQEVADVALGYLILLARHLHQIDAAVRRGEWFKPTGTSLQGRVLGVVGAGSVGLALIERANCLGMHVLVTDPSKRAVGRARDLGARSATLDELVAEADYVVLACPLTEDTFHLIDGRRLQLMRQGAAIVNVSRGELIDEQSLVAALSRRAIRAAALDVFRTEPLPTSSKLIELENVILGSHNASNTLDAAMRVTKAAIDNLVGALAQYRAEQ